MNSLCDGEFVDCLSRACLWVRVWWRIWVTGGRDLGVTTSTSFASPSSNPGPGVMWLNMVRACNNIRTMLYTDFHLTILYINVL